MNQREVSEARGGERSLHKPLFLGQPRGLAYLAITEAWERFSYYGMSSLLVLYMIEHVFIPEHADDSWGLAGLRAAIVAIVGPLSRQALAAQVFGLYSGFVYLTPVLGGIIADRWCGRRRMVLAGVMVLSVGHILMAFEAMFLGALALLIIGCGCLKGNISAQVGSLYATDENARTKGFTVFSMAINIGSIAGPLVCGLLAQLYGWHTAFAASGTLMLVGLATYIRGYRYLPSDRAECRSVAKTSMACAGDRSTLRPLLLVMIIGLCYSIAYNQLFNVGLVWIRDTVDRRLLGFEIPVPWFASFDAFFSVSGAPLVVWLWKRQAARGREPAALTKVGIGAAIMSAGNLLLMGASICASNGMPVNILWAVGYTGATGFAFLYCWPTLLALVSSAAPPSVNATFMGAIFLIPFLANNIVGRLGALYERIPHAHFWAIHAAIGATGTLVVAIVGRRISRSLAAVA